MKEIWNRFSSARFLTIVSTALLFLVIGNNTIADDHAEESTSPHVWSANMMMASEYVFRGITQSNEDPAIQVGIDYAHEPSGFYIGTWASSVEFNTGNADGTQIETNLYGGFAGSEKQLEERNWAKNNTVLSGEIGSLSTSDDNCYTVLYTRNVSEETRIDGFTITGGAANGLGEKGDLRRCGGGWFNDGSGGNSSPMVVNCTFVSNFGRDGAAVYNFTEHGVCQPTIENCQFMNNKADLDGGAMYNDSRRGICNPILKDCRVVNNEATYGGGILNYTEGGETSPTITGCSFEDNIGYVRGGSIYSNENGGKCEPSVASTYFSDNRATVGKDIYEDKMINRREEGVVVSRGKVTKL